MKKLRYFTINPKCWAYGDITSLYDKGFSRKKCCLGFMGQQLGVPLSEMACISLPYHLPLKFKVKYEEAGLNSELEDICTMINDNSSSHLDKPKARIIELNKSLIAKKAPFRFRLESK